MNILPPGISMKLRYLKYVGAAVVTLIFGFHFFNTVLYNAPQNVISTVYSFDKVYISGLLAQEWAMFAPEPMDRDTNVLVKCLDTAGGRSTGFHDITSDFNRLRTRNIFVSADRVARVPGNWAYLYIAASRWEQKLHDECKANAKSASCENWKAMKDQREKTSKDGLTLVASYYCRDASRGTHYRYESAEITLKVIDVARWSQRHKANSGETYFVNVGNVKLNQVSGRPIWN
ncbi:DUF5819 family protein [Deinococcus planocerae]|uniref:DUF5819 family protein n=1 Tax=Deinococcus planocerae TaxID=1737569 RepID=UPI0011AF578C|nr:DUF5819 family protein [Deinococcus planocerae]